MGLSKRLNQLCVSFDAFGEPISVNYKGDTSYKTALGALCTIVIKTFILVFTIEQLIALAGYQDPQIVQVSRPCSLDRFCATLVHEI